MKRFLLVVLVFAFINVQTYAEKTEDESKNMLTLADKLEKGEPYLTKFKHPFTGEMLEKKVVGIVDNKCLYVEEMPNGGKMECRYSPESRKAVAQYYRDLANSESYRTKARISLTDGKQKVKYTINGKEVKNPLEECLKNGECIISGY